MNNNHDEKGRFSSGEGTQKIGGKIFYKGVQTSRAAKVGKVHVVSNPGTGNHYTVPGPGRYVNFGGQIRRVADK